MANAGFKLIPIPDETIFGLCTQVGVLKGAQTYSECFKLIFGDDPKRRADLLVTAAARMDALLEFVDVDGPEQLLNCHSVWPYFLAFQNTSVSDVLALGKQVANPFRLLGQGGIQAIEEPKIDKYCPLCAAEQVEIYGRTAWLRSHQLPGVVVCHKHGVSLREGNFRMENTAMNTQKIVFPIAANEVGASVRNDSAATDVWSVGNPNLLWARISHAALATNGLFSDMSKVLRLYQGELQRRNLMVSGKYDWPEIHRAFRHRYGDLFAKQLSIDFSCERNEWLRRLLSGTCDFRQPSRHLLVLGALFGALPTAQAISENEKKFDSNIVKDDHLERRKTKPRARDRSEIRQLIEDLLRADPSLTRQGLGARLGSRKYKWVLQNDGEWLDKKIIKRAIPKSRETANWHARSVKLINAVNRLNTVQRSQVFSQRGVNRAELSRISNLSKRTINALIDRRKVQFDRQCLQLAC